MLFPVAIATLGVTCFAAGIAGQFRHPLPLGLRLAVFAAAGLLLAPGPTLSAAGVGVPVIDVVGVALAGGVLAVNRRPVSKGEDGKASASSPSPRMAAATRRLRTREGLGRWAAPLSEVVVSCWARRWSAVSSGHGSSDLRRLPEGHRG